MTVATSAMLLRNSSLIGRHYDPDLSATLQIIARDTIDLSRDDRELLRGLAQRVFDMERDLHVSRNYAVSLEEQHAALADVAKSWKAHCDRLSDIVRLRQDMMPNTYGHVHLLRMKNVNPHPSWTLYPAYRLTGKVHRG